MQWFTQGTTYNLSQSSSEISRRWTVELSSFVILFTALSCLLSKDQNMGIIRLCLFVSLGLVLMFNQLSAVHGMALADDGGSEGDHSSEVEDVRERRDALSDDDDSLFDLFSRDSRSSFSHRHPTTSSRGGRFGRRWRAMQRYEQLRRGQGREVHM